MKVLVDTSVWVQHFRSGATPLGGLLKERAILMHPFVMGEVACGNLKDRTAVFEFMSEMPEATTASNEEALQLIEDRKLYGRGLGWADVHLLASALLTSCGLWTLDKSLHQAARELGIDVSVGTVH